jgi:hypothetical protein
MTRIFSATRHNSRALHRIGSGALIRLAEQACNADCPRPDCEEIFGP